MIFMMNKESPGYYKTAFPCPRCSVLCPQNWYSITKGTPGEQLVNIVKVDIEMIQARNRRVMNYGLIEGASDYDWNLDLSICDYCNEYTIWENEKIIYPFTIELPSAHIDMPGEVKGIYEEAAMVFKHSPRASAALLRLAIETLIPMLGIQY